MLTGITYILDDVTPVQITDGGELGEYTVVLRTSAPTIIGADDVSTASGLLIDADDRLVTLRIQGESLYAISSSGAAALGVLAYTA